MTILVPALNAAPFLNRALTSVMNQSRDDWTVQVLVDCASVDSTYTKAKQVRGKSKRAKSIFINVSQRPGLPNVYKELIDRAEPKDGICGFLDADDRLMDDAVRRIMACYESKPALGHVWSQFCLHPSGAVGWSRRLPAGALPSEAFSKGWWGSQHWRTFRKSVFTNSPYRLQTDVPYATDYNLALVLAATDCEFFFLNKPLYVYYQTATGITQSKARKQRENFDEMLRRFKKWLRGRQQCAS